jgi:hypothetical protein
MTRYVKREMLTKKWDYKNDKGKEDQPINDIKDVEMWQVTNEPVNTFHKHSSVTSHVHQVLIFQIYEFLIFKNNNLVLSDLEI